MWVWGVSYWEMRLWMPNGGDRQRNDERKLLSKWMSGEEVEADLKDEL